ncbi:MAG TPA: hypothetical protein VF063_02840 [Gaiellaceae bacterium]
MTLRNVAVLVAGAVLLSVPGTASGSKSAALRPTAIFRTGKIALLAADGTRAAVAPAKRRPCGAVVVWNTSTGRSSGFRLHTNGCMGDGVRELALGDAQVAWIEHGGGNSLELTVFAARLGGGRARELDFQANGDRAGADPAGGWVGFLRGGGSVLAYNRWRVVCDRPDVFSCGEKDPQLRITDERLIRIALGRVHPVASGPAAYAVTTAGGGRIAVQRPDGIATYTSAGRSLAFVPDPQHRVTGVGLSSSALALERNSTLDLYDAETGAPRRSIGLGSETSPALLGLTKTLALVELPRTLLLVRLADGARATIALPLVAQRGLVGVRLTDAGMFYAYNLRSGSAPGRVAFVPTRALAKAF